MREYQIYIGGKWKRSSGEKLQVINPYNNTPVGATLLATESDVEEAISTATEAFQAMRVLPSYRRAEVLLHIANGLKKQREEIATMITDDRIKIPSFKFRAQCAQPTHNPRWGL